MIDKYQANVESLSPAEAALLMESMEKRYTHLGFKGGEDAWGSLKDTMFDQADLILALAPNPSPQAIVVLEKLVGKPITRETVPSYPKTGRPRTQVYANGGVKQPDVAAAQADWVITRVEPNPKRVNSKSWERYNHYKVGLTVGDVMRLGITSADIRWDTSRGFVQIKRPGG